MRSDRVAAGAVVGLAGLALAGRVARRRATARCVAELRRAARTDDAGVVTAADLDGLPDPVREYLRSVLPEGQRYVRSVAVEQEGHLRAGGLSSPWRSFEATHRATTSPPGFLWDAAIAFGPGRPVRVRDLYRDGAGSARVSLFGALPLDGAEASPELNEAALMRYLAEAVWYPTALLPSEGVEWAAVDDEAADATVGFRGASATLRFTFDGAEVRSVHADARYRRVGDGYEATPWTGHWRNYETRNGLSVPTEGDVTWHLPDGPLRAWHGRVTEIRYDEW